MYDMYDVVLVVGALVMRIQFQEVDFKKSRVLMDSQLEEGGRSGRVRFRGAVDVQEAQVEERACHCGCVRACVALLSACFRSGNHSFARLRTLRT